MTSENLSASAVWNPDEDNNVIVSDSTIQQANDRYFFAARDAGDTQYYDLIKLNASDQLLVNSNQLGANRQLLLGEELSSLTVSHFGKVFVTEAGSTTDASVPTLSHALESSGTPAANFGISNNFYAHDDANTMALLGTLEFDWTDASTGSVSSKARLFYQNSGSAESMWFGPEGISQDQGTSYFRWNGGVQSFSPTVSGTTGAGSGTYTRQGGWQLQLGAVGNGVMWIGGWVAWSAHTGTGSLLLDLPVAVRAGADTSLPGSVVLQDYTYSAGATPALVTSAGDSEADLVEMSSAGSVVPLAMDTEAGLRFSLIYPI